MGTVVAMTGREHGRQRVFNHSITPEVYDVLDLNWDDSEQERPDKAIRPLLLLQLFLNVGIIVTLGIVGIWMLCHL